MALRDLHGAVRLTEGRDLPAVDKGDVWGKAENADVGLDTICDQNLGSICIEKICQIRLKYAKFFDLLRRLL